MLDIESWIYKAFDEVIPYGSGTDLRVNCPFCSESDTGQHLYISLVHETCHCFKCDYSSSWLGLVVGVEGGSYNDAREAIGDGGIVPLYKLLRRDVANVTEILAMRQSQQPNGMSERFYTLDEAMLGHSIVARRNAEMVLKYVTRRMGTADRYLDQWGVWKDALGYGRLIVPVERGWWTSRRVLEGMSPKYLSCRNPKGDILYNHRALDKYNRVAIAEGVFSAEFVGDHCVALCGKTATPAQLNRLIQSRVHEFEICLDSGTERETDELAHALHRGGKSVDVRMYANGDPASSTQYKLLPYSMTTSLRMKWGMV